MAPFLGLVSLLDPIVEKPGIRLVVIVNGLSSLLKPIVEKQGKRLVVLVNAVGISLDPPELERVFFKWSTLSSGKLDVSLSGAFEKLT